MDVSSWVSAAAAVASVGFAVFAWWRSNLSRKAKIEAEEAAQRSRAHLEATESIARSLEGPPLKLKKLGASLLRLRNKSARELTITEVINADEFIGFNVSMPLTLQSGESVEIRTFQAWGHAWPGQMTVRIQDRAHVVHVRVPD